jgi:hypothetical protein
MADGRTLGRRPRRLVAGVAAAILLFAVAAWRLAVDTTDEPAASTTSAHSAPVSGAAMSASKLLARARTAGQWPGTNGLSGVNGDPVLNTAHVTAFCTARGRPCKIAHTYTDRSSYATMTSGTSWTFSFFAGFDGALVVSQGLAPTGGEADLAGCAAGEYDSYWHDFGALMVRYGRGDSVVRLGWEMNESTMPWRATDTATYIACYRRAADNLRAADPAVILDWTINGHGTPAGLCDGLSTNCYPGDAYVDIIGIDNYDHYPAATTRAAFDQAAQAPEGLTWLYDFARAHGKPFSVGEWGVVSGTGGGGDNPAFVTWMHAWFAAHATELAYEAYFSNCDTGGVQSSLYRTDADCTQNPNSATVYRKLFGTR